MKLGNEEVDKCNLYKSFADHFDKKVNTYKVDKDMFNGYKKVTCVNTNFEFC